MIVTTRPPERVAAGLDVGVGRPALELQHQDARHAQDHARGEDRDERRVLAAVVEHVPDERVALLAAHQLADPGQAAQPGEPEQRGELEEAEARDRPDQVEPAALVDEVARPRPGAGDVVGEVDQEDDADRVVVDVEQLVGCPRRRGRSSRTISASEKMVRTRMKML